MSRWAAAWARRRFKREMQAYEQPEVRVRPLRLPAPGRADYHFRSLVQVNFFAKPKA